jgi:hypothetical protein
MKIFAAFLCVCGLCLGCKSNPNQASWDLAKRDAMGENMQMRYFGGSKPADDEAVMQMGK